MHKNRDLGVNGDTSLVAFLMTAVAGLAGTVATLASLLYRSEVRRREKLEEELEQKEELLSAYRNETDLLAPKVEEIVKRPIRVYRQAPVRPFKSLKKG